MSLRALLFDYGGTLDAPGVPWVDRLLEIYAAVALPESPQQIRAAFGHATRSAYADTHIRNFGLEQTVAFHVDCQLRFLGRYEPGLATTVADHFVHHARADLAASRATLERLHPRFTLGVISNFYGNVHILLAEAGIAPLLAVITDSTRAGVSKPDPAIFRLTLDNIGCTPEEALYVGDSFDKDIAGAHSAGLRTAWLTGTGERECPDPALVDLRLRHLDELDTLLP